MLAVAWAGALLFLVSLAYFAYFYAVVLGRPQVVAADAVPTALVFNIGLFTLFALHHSVLARDRAKRLLARVVPATLERAAYVWIASLLFLGVCLLWQPLPGMAWEASGAAAWLLHGVQAAGVILTLRSAARIDIWDLAGVRQAAAPPSPVAAPRADPATAASPARSAVQPASPPALEVTGPYRWLRHPIYLGWVVIVFGAPAMTTGRLLFAAISTAYLVVAIPFEERSLTREFGRAYEDYQRRVRWRLVPGIW